MMLRIANVEVRTEGKKLKDSEIPEKAYTSEVGKALEDFNKAVKANDNAKRNLQFLTYNQLNHKFGYQVPVRFEPIANTSKVLGIELITKPKTEKTPEEVVLVLIDATCKLLAHTNRMTTVLGAQALSYMTSGGPALVGYICDEYWDEYQKIKDSGSDKALEALEAKFSAERKEKVIFLPIKRVFDYEEEVKMQAEKNTRVVKSGRPKKNAPKLLKEMLPEERSVIRVVLADGGLIVSDRVLVK